MNLNNSTWLPSILVSFILLAVCPNMATLNEPSGVLTSPYYPRRYRPSNEKCSWKIPASKGERIVLVIKDVYIKDCGSSCTCNYLEIQNGSSSDGISDRRRCGKYKDRGIVYHSVKDVLRVTFVSDSGTYPHYRGFKATYIKVKYNATTTGKLLEIGFKRINTCAEHLHNLRWRCTWGRPGCQVSRKEYKISLPYIRSWQPLHSNTLQSNTTQTKMSMKCQQFSLLWCL